MLAVSFHYSSIRYEGFIWNGDLYLLGVQTLAVVVIIIWSCASTFFLLFTIDLICPIRMAEHMELLGADYCEVGFHFSYMNQLKYCFSLSAQRLPPWVWSDPGSQCAGPRSQVQQ